MFSYQHGYHAGGPADMVKHAVLAMVLARLTAKPRPFTYYETHAGRGVYDLSAPEALKTGEYQHGIARVWPQRASAPAGLEVLWQGLEGFVDEEWYPGSPLLAAQIVRPDDQLVVCEGHPQEHAALLQAMADYPNVQVYKTDGPRYVINALPAPSGRGVVLIDPSYEVKTEYAATVECVAAMLAKAPKTVVVVWYPLLPDGRQQVLVDGVVALSQPATYQAEVEWSRPQERGAYGTGLLVVNLPFGLDEPLKDALAWLAPVLAAEATLRCGYVCHPV